jgi:DeoR/GlpR family transcriptional regulator of sugar metabolism
MNPKTRRSRILDILNNEERASVDELAEKLKTSKETIRRDLTSLVRDGKIRKFHGGAQLSPRLEEGPFRQRMAENSSAKRAIARSAVELFQAGETLFVDTGSTTLYFAERLTELSDITVVTNSTEIARVLGQSNNRNRVFLLGGEYSADNQQTIGSLAISQVKTFRAHHVVLTVGALDCRSGVMDYNIEEAQIAKAMIAQAEKLTILADSSKLNRIASFEVCRLSSVYRLVCETTPTGSILQALNEAGVEMIVADHDAA